MIFNSSPVHIVTCYFKLKDLNKLGQGFNKIKYFIYVILEGVRNSKIIVVVVLNKSREEV